MKEAKKAQTPLFTTAVVSLLSILLFFLSTFPCSAKQMTILVESFENTGAKEYSWIAAGMKEHIIAELRFTRGISVVGNPGGKKIREETKPALSGPAGDGGMMALAGHMGMHVIFTGSYVVSDSRVRLYPRLVEVETGRVRNAAVIEGAASDIVALQDKVVSALRGMAEDITLAGIEPVKFTAEDKKRIGAKPRPGAEAYAWYAKGLEVRDSDPKEALANFRKTLDMDPGYTDALLSAGFTAGDTLSLFDEGLGYLEKAEGIFKGRNETGSADYARLMMRIGNVYGNKHQPDRALEYYRNAQSIWDGLGLQNIESYARLMGNIGNIYDNKGQPDRALEYDLNSRAILDRLGLTSTQIYARLMENIGVVYKGKGQTDLALECYLNSQSIQDRLGLTNTRIYAHLMGNIGLLYMYKGQTDLALEYYLNAQSIFERLGLRNTVTYATIMMTIGVVHGRKGRADLALECFLNSQSIQDKLGLQNTANYARLMGSIGLAYESKGQSDRALEYDRNAQAIFDRLGMQNTAGYATILYNMALLYEKRGEPDMAGNHYRKAYDTCVSAGYSGEARDKALDAAKRLGY